MLRGVSLLAALGSMWAAPARAQAPLEESLRLAVSALEGGGARLRASVEGAPDGIVRRVSIMHREGDGEWEPAPETLALDATSPRVEYYAVAIGPGGAIVARAGSEGAPRVWRGGAVVSGGDDGLAIGLGVAGGVAALAAVIAIAVAASSGGSNTIGAPAVTW